MKVNTTSETDGRDTTSDDDQRDPTTDTEETDPPVDRRANARTDVTDTVRRRSEAVADREVQQALRKLEARGDLTEGQQRAVREMADDIVESLVAAPARTVEAARAADDETLQTVVDLFDPDTDE
jgi:glutamyl-tRNA reductase